MKPHKHAELIKAWADGAEIQVKNDDGVWRDADPFWCDYKEYRIKPSEIRARNHNPDTTKMTKPDYVEVGQVVQAFGDLTAVEIPEMPPVGTKLYIVADKA